MTGARDYADYLRDIVDAAGKAERFVEDTDFEGFSANDEKIFAVIRALEVIGEAAKNVPEDLRQQYPHIPWRSMAGMRDVLIHQYFGVQLQRIWTTVQEDIPTVREAVAGVLAEIESEPDPL